MPGTGHVLLTASFLLLLAVRFPEVRVLEHKPWDGGTLRLALVAVPGLPGGYHGVIELAVAGDRIVVKRDHDA